LIFKVNISKVNSMKDTQILIIDLGSQYTLIIGRTLRELGIRSVIFSTKRASDWLKYNKPKGIILSGGSASVYEKDAPSPPEEILKLGVPILGICYGMQWLAYKLGGTVVSHRENKEYGKAKASFDYKDRLFLNLNKKNTVWASHGDSVDSVPKGFKAIAWTSNNKVIAGMSHLNKKIWGVQFHPEVTQTEKGKDILLRFIKNICKCKKDWKPKDIITNIQNEVKEVAADKKSIIGFSGGVDSSTLSVILSPVLKSNLLAICIDTGGLRQSEIKEIRENARVTNVRLKIIRASSRFQKAIGNATHSEIKRKRFKKLYGRILEEAARDFKANFIIQGSLATDIIESGAIGKADLIKSHHNVGLNLKVKELHLFRDLFKYEVRGLAEEMGLPDSISKRQPFPGPGLFIRVIGKPPKLDKLSIVRWADARVTKILKEHKLYNEISQLIVGLDCNRSVGIKGDGRAYGFSIIVRGFVTADFMTGRGYQIPRQIRRQITNNITKHPKIIRVYYDETHKPPATIELE